MGVRAEIHQILGIGNVGGMGNYLGIPESLGGAKTKIFNFLIDRQNQRLNGWTSKLLSKGGKEILLKSVLSAMPSHVMSCFRLPKGVTNKLTSAVATFWWSNNGQSRGMHWLAWKKLCRHKDDGGLGFRTIDDFNTALLAKQLWRLIDKPGSLFARVFKGRYFRNCGPLDTIRSYSPSYGWRSIISARPLVNKGLIKRVGSGDSISVWNDPWIPDSRPRSAICNGVNYYPHLRVSELIDRSTSTWNLPLLHQFFTATEIEAIIGIPISNANWPDSLGWAFTKTGRYTVKSGYSTAQKYTDNNLGPTYGPDVRPLLAKVWKMQCSPKIRHFVWNAIMGCVPVGTRLEGRGIQIDPVCTRCGLAAETINHALFECPPALQVWALSPIPTPMHVFPIDALLTNIAHLFWHLPNDDSVLIYPWLLWYVWKARNDKLFSNIDREPPDIVSLAAAEAKAWAEAQIQDVVLLPGPTRMDPGLPERMERCQVDGSWKITECREGLGWYYHNTVTDEKLMGASNLRRGLSPLQAELEALVWAMQCMLRHNKRTIVFETDCSDIVKMVSTPEEWPAFSILLDEIDKCKREFTLCSVMHIPRTRNTRADKLARSARDLPYNVYFINHTPPTWISGPV
uniref:Putative mitochondrial protein n=1 Tax=Noccaea caerulescens TaxID=107243 RepID=A0A1J3E5Y1_NOCCA